MSGGWSGAQAQMGPRSRRERLPNMCQLVMEVTCRTRRVSTDLRFFLLLLLVLLDGKRLDSTILARAWTWAASSALEGSFAMVLLEASGAGAVDDMGDRSEGLGANQHGRYLSPACYRIF
jgi:hypothetical protein